MAFIDAVKPRTRVHFMVPRGINRTVWGTKLLLTPVLASFVDCISLCHTEGTALLFESEWLHNMIMIMLKTIIRLCFDICKKSL